MTILFCIFFALLIAFIINGLLIKHLEGGLKKGLKFVSFFICILLALAFGIICTIHQHLEGLIDKTANKIEDKIFVFLPENIGFNEPINSNQIIDIINALKDSIESVRENIYVDIFLSDIIDETVMQIFDELETKYEVFTDADGNVTIHSIINVIKKHIVDTAHPYFVHAEIAIVSILFFYIMLCVMVVLFNKKKHIIAANQNMYVEHTKEYSMEQKKDGEIFCSSCGAIIKVSAKFCPNCGNAKQAVDLNNDVEVLHNVTKSDWFTTLLLCIFLGGFGAHRFYTGKISTGILMILTLGGVGIWWLIDLIMIATCKFKNKSGQYLLRGI